MTDTAQDIPRVPDRSDRVRETLLCFEHVSDRPSSMLGIDDAHLFEIGLLLSDRKLSTAEAWRQTNELIGPREDGTEAISRSTFYRFADRFSSLLGQVTAEHAQCRVRMTVSHATDDKIANLNRLSRHRFAELLAEKLVSTDDLAEIDRYMAKMATLLADAERARQADERLELDQLNYERRLSETRAKLDLAEARVDQMQRDAELKRQRIEERLTQLRTTLETLKQRASRGERITEDQLRHADADLEAIRGAAA